MTLVPPVDLRTWDDGDRAVRRPAAAEEEFAANDVRSCPAAPTSLAEGTETVPAERRAQ
ncbi:hypothetical protein [Amycolatopsis sp. NPDC102389]|uniref:hypothetical protein n=1 Tax=Amycolatopsis sp. NPDC102389 TaxID=3363941 RepID=UPI0037FC786B